MMKASSVLRVRAAVAMAMLPIAAWMAGCEAQGTRARQDATDRAPYTDAPAPEPAGTPSPAPAAARVGPVDQPGHVPVERRQARDQVIVPADEPAGQPAGAPRQPQPPEQE